MSLANRLTGLCSKGGEFYRTQVYFKYLASDILKSKAVSDLLDELFKDGDVARQIKSSIAQVVSAQATFITHLSNALGKVCPQVNLNAIKAEAISKSKEIGEDASQKLKVLCQVVGGVLQVGQEICKIASQVLKIAPAKLGDFITGGRVTIIKEMAENCVRVTAVMGNFQKTICQKIK